MLRLNKIETGQWIEAWKNTFSICKEPNTDRPEEAIMGFHTPNLIVATDKKHGTTT